MDALRLCGYRDGSIREESNGQDRLLRLMYGTLPGRMLIRPLVCPGFSRQMGRLLDTKASRILIEPFRRANHISLDGCEKQEFVSYNDFFTRKLKPGWRPFDSDPAAFISPCDARLTVYPIREKGSFRIKHTEYTLPQLLRDERLARRFCGGNLYLFRLSVEDYHRYLYIDEGICSGTRRIEGVLHTVNPAANDALPIYKENTREYTLLKTRNFGTVLMMEVGALMVGRIVNTSKRPARAVKRGEEKGYFAFGGSTVLLLTERGRVKPAKDILRNSLLGIETRVLQGETVGRKSSKQ